MSNSSSPPPPGTRTSFSNWYQQEINRLENNKAGKDWAKSEFKRIERYAQEARRIALEARAKADTHECIQLDTLRALSSTVAEIDSAREGVVTELGRWTWFRKALIPIILAIGATIITAIVAFVELRSSVSAGQDDMAEIKETMKVQSRQNGDVSEIKQSLIELKQTVRDGIRFKNSSVERADKRGQ